MRVLCLDIEGGYGGSSRSLYESVSQLPGEIEVEIWCRREGPVQAKYEALGVECRVMSGMPHISSLPRLSRNLNAYGRFAAGWRKSRQFRDQLVRASQQRFDLIHLNHEGLFLLARWLRRELGNRVRLTAHVRTHLPSTIFSRWQYRILSAATDRLVFITEMERDKVAKLTRRPQTGPVIYNIVPALDPARVDPILAAESRFKVVSVSNYAWLRGNDRLIDIAASLKAMGRTDILFVAVGQGVLPNNLPGELGRVARRGGTMADYAEARKVADMFRFVGHVADPTPVLSASDLLVRPSRGNDPWGREVLEAMAVGLPVLATGRFDRFVETGCTGILHPDFNASAMARAIVDLADNRGKAAAMGVAARNRVTDLCDGPMRAAELAGMWRGVAA